jgi:hypothetical protein
MCIRFLGLVLTVVFLYSVPGSSERLEFTFTGGINDVQYRIDGKTVSDATVAASAFKEYMVEFESNSICTYVFIVDSDQDGYYYDVTGNLVQAVGETTYTEYRYIDKTLGIDITFDIATTFEPFFCEYIDGELLDDLTTDDVSNSFYGVNWESTMFLGAETVDTYAGTSLNSGSLSHWIVLETYSPVNIIDQWEVGTEVKGTERTIFDNFSISVTTALNVESIVRLPEPSSYLLLFLGITFLIIGVLVYKKRSSSS